MSEIVRGRTRGGYLTIDNYIQDGLLEIGSIDLAGFYGALKRFVDRRESGDGRAMPWTVSLFCSKFKIGKQRFYRLAELLWRTGLLDVEKDFGLINPEKGIMGWRNRYVVHDFPDYEGPLRLARDGSFKYRKAVDGKQAKDAGEKEVEFDGEAVRGQVGENPEGKEKIKDTAGESGVFPYRNTPEGEVLPGGISTTEIPATEIPAVDISVVEPYIKNKGSKRQGINKKQDNNTVVVGAAGKVSGGEGDGGGPVLSPKLEAELRAVDEQLLSPALKKLYPGYDEGRIRMALSVVRQQGVVENLPAFFREALVNGWVPGRTYVPPGGGKLKRPSVKKVGVDRESVKNRALEILGREAGVFIDNRIDRIAAIFAECSGEEASRRLRKMHFISRLTM